MTALSSFHKTAPNISKSKPKSCSDIFIAETTIKILSCVEKIPQINETTTDFNLMHFMFKPLTKARNFSVANMHSLTYMIPLYPMCA